jgi:sulfite dehydrogenase (quinone) subunit SoeC
MSAGSFNTREFFHGRSLALLKNVKLAFIVLCFALPAALALWGVIGGGALPWMLAVICLVPGLIAERWFFFAQAKHPQNLYYQVVS